MNNPIKQFEEERKERIDSNISDKELLSSAHAFMKESVRAKYSYNFSWLGRPIIQYPQDMIAVQEIIWQTQPDLLIETGIAHGGSLIFYASIFEMIGKGKVLGVDIDIREHNRVEIEAHPMSKRIQMIQGSSTSQEIFQIVKNEVDAFKTVMVCLDSNHTHQHVIDELRLYAPLVSKGNYCVVFDTHVEDMGTEMDWSHRWGVGDNPKTAVHQYLSENDLFEIDPMYFNKSLISVCPDGFLKRVK